MHKILYMATVTFTRPNPAGRDFGTCLYVQGKSREVTMVAVMRNLRRVLNAVRRGQVPWQPGSATTPNEA